MYITPISDTQATATENQRKYNNFRVLGANIRFYVRKLPKKSLSIIIGG